MLALSLHSLTVFAYLVFAKADREEGTAVAQACMDSYRLVLVHLHPNASLLPCAALALIWFRF